MSTSRKWDDFNDYDELNDTSFASHRGHQSLNDHTKHVQRTPSDHVRPRNGTQRPKHKISRLSGQSVLPNNDSNDIVHNASNESQRKIKYEAEDRIRGGARSPVKEEEKEHVTIEADGARGHSPNSRSTLVASPEGSRSRSGNPVKMQSLGGKRKYLAMFFFAIVTGIYFLGYKSNNRSRPVMEPLFDMERWDAIQQEIALLHSSISRTTFADSDRIRTSVHRFRTSLHGCRPVVVGLGVELGTRLTSYVQEWVFKGNCTSALSYAVAENLAHVEQALDCVDGVTADMNIASDQVQTAEKDTRDTYQAIVARHQSVLPAWLRSEQLSPTEYEADFERERATSKSISELKSVRSQLDRIMESIRPERDWLMRWKNGMRSMSSLVASPAKHDGRGNAASDCGNFDTDKVGEAFLSVITDAIGDDAKIQRFHCRYRLPFPVPLPGCNEGDTAGPTIGNPPH
ncbi:MAG: hypothetical protein Q9218_002256 [Villophora microphyllina]